MKNVYACLLGEWVRLSDDPEAKIGHNGQSPNIWYEEGADLWAPLQREKGNSLYELEYVWIKYLGKSYKIHPSLIQIAEE